MFNISGSARPVVLHEPVLSWEIASKDNKWQGRNISRWRNTEYDEIYRSLSGEFDPVRRAAKFIRLNELIIDNRVAIPLVNRPQVGAAAHRLRMTLSAWDSHLWLLKDWYREG